MKQTINVYQFRDAFRDMGREDNFSYDGLGVLFDSLESLADDTGQEVELDVIALCCEFSEADADEIASDYGIDVSEAENDEELAEIVLDYLADHTFVCGQTSGTIVFQQF